MQLACAKVSPCHVQRQEVSVVKCVSFLSEIRLVSVNPNAKVAHIPVQMVQDKSAPWRPRHEFDLSLS